MVAVTWRRALAIAGCALFWAASDTRAEDEAAGEPDATPAPLAFDGPAELQDVFLPAQTRPQMFPESAALLPKNAFSVDLVGDWANHFAKQDDYVFDGESVTSTLRLRYAPWRRFEVGLDVPWTTRVHGTLDSLIEDVEDSLDARVRERFSTPQSSWEALVIGDDGRREMRMLDDAHQGDVAVRAKFAIATRAELGFDAAFVASLGLPTRAATYGGEGVTPRIGLHAQKPFETVNLFGGATLQYHTDATEQDFRLAPYRWMTYAGAEWRPWRGWLGILLQYQVYGRLARGHDPLDEPAHYYAGGFRVYLPARVTLEAIAVENMGLIENRNSTDISLHVGLGWTFGGR
jgi:hypothetical protein